MRGCLPKATALRPNTIFFSLHCGAKSQNYVLVVACFSLLCNPGAISLSRVAYHMESEKYAVSSPPLKLPALNRLTKPFFLFLLALFVNFVESSNAEKNNSHLHSYILFQVNLILYLNSTQLYILPHTHL